MGNTFAYWLSADPPILHHQLLDDRDYGEYLPEDRIYRLVKVTFHKSADVIAADYERARRTRPRHRVHYLLDEEHVVRELKARGIPAHFIHQNALLDERIYTIQPEQEKRFQAVYIAWLNSMKRHVLASGLESVLVIGGSAGFIGDGDPEAYVRSVRDGLPRAEFANLDSGRFMGDAEVATAVNQAKVGLCLSAAEGGMYAATEYLLCGLPVVSTVSQGGRDHWFGPHCARIVMDNAPAVAQGVKDLLELDLSAVEIRQLTLRRLWPHRWRLIELVQSFFDEERTGRDYGREFYDRFTNKLGHWREPDLVWDLRTVDCPT